MKKIVSLSLALLFAASLAAATSVELPPNAKPGECYARVFAPPTFGTSTERVLVHEAGTRLEIVPARYEWVEQRVEVEQASERLEVIPARYDWTEERIMVRPETTELVEVPAKYDTTEERILVKPAQTEWKKGRGAVEKVDNATGEIMCLVEEPAEYKTVRKQVLVSPPTTKKVTKPAEYKTVRKKVLVEPAKTRTVPVPAKHATVKVMKEVEPAKVKEINVPAQYATVTKTSKLSEGRLEWQRIVCETNATTSLIASVQRALKQAGHDPGAVDGVFGPSTMTAIQRYQRANGMPEGFLTFDTLKALGVEAASGLGGG